MYEYKGSVLLWAERRRLIVNSVWLEIFVVSFFFIGAFSANTSSDWFIGNAGDFL